MASCDDAAGAQNEPRVGRIDHDRVWNRVYLVEPYNLSVTTEPYFVAASKDIQVADLYVVTHLEFANPNYQVEMTDLCIILDNTFARVDNAQPDPDPFPDFIPEEQPEAWPLQERREQGDKH
jgi:hypothetical protein